MGEAEHALGPELPDELIRPKGAPRRTSPICAGTWSRAGHRVDLYAESWAEGALAAGGERDPGAGDGQDPAGAALKLRPQLGSSHCGKASHDCSVGFINTWSHDVIIPQGGVQSGSLAAKLEAVCSPFAQPLYLRPRS